MSRIKHALKQALQHPARWASRAPGPLHQRRIVLTYHSVGRRHHGTNVRPEAFAQQMAWLADHVQVRPAQEVLGGAPGVAITFDDGYAMNLEHAVPVLQAHRMPATFFLVAGCLGGYLPPRADPTRSRIVSEADVQALARAGFEIGAHTLSHPHLARLPRAEQRREIAESRAHLQAVSGQPVDGFAYPYGSVLDYTSETAALVREAGYAYAVTNRYGPCDDSDDGYTHRRLWADHADGLAVFEAKVRGRLDGLRIFEWSAAVRARRTLNRLLRAP